MLKNQALRGDMMRGHASTIESEIRRMVAGWGDEGEIDLLDFFAELTIYTTSACLIGKPFREELDERFAHHYHELERGTDALAYVDPYMQGSRASSAGTRPARRWSRWCRGSSTGGRHAARCRRRTATCSTC